LPGTASRGITAGDVDRAADELLRAGERPTIEKVRIKIGRGSPNTINPLLDDWWSRLAGRLDAGPAALHRLPQAVAMAAEALWLTAVKESRERAAQEQQSSRSRLARDRQDLEVRSHVLSIREAELQDRLRERDRRIETLEAELRTLTTLLRKAEAATKLKRSTAREDEPKASRSRPARATEKPRTTRGATRRSTTAGRPPAAPNRRKQARKSTSARAPARRKVTISSKTRRAPARKR